MKQPLLLLSLAFAPSLMAQPVFQSTDFQPAIGAQLTALSTDYRAAGPATNGFVYDLSTLPLGAATTSTILLPSATPYGTYYPAATHASAGLVNPQSYVYLQLTATQEVLLGLYGPSVQLIYTDPQQVAAFPLQLGTTWNDDFAGTQTVSGMDVARTGTSTGNYNGYGTVILPFGTFTNVARVEMTQTYSDNFSGLTYTTIVHVVSYLKAGLSQALFSTNFTLSDVGGTMDTVGTSSSMVDPASIGIRENSRSILASVWPNPASGTATIQLAQSANPGLSIALYDATGRIVRHVHVNAGMERIPLDLKGLRSGLYFLRATDSAGAVGNWPLTVE